MGPRKSRRQAFIRLPKAKRIFEVDHFLLSDGYRRTGTKISQPLIKEVSTGRRIEGTADGVSQLEVHFWVGSEDDAPIQSETVHLPNWWTSKIYLAAFLQMYHLHDCICIRTERLRCGPVEGPFRSLSIVSSLYSCSRAQLEETLRLSLHSVEGGSMI
jgi:hypothetical protein